jgi:hypothetical protein
VNKEFRIHLRGMPQPDLPEGEWITTMSKPSREELVLSYAEKPVRGFMQVDAHGLCEDGVVIHTHFLFELRNTDNPVRVLIPEGTTRGEALFYLLEIVKMLREDWYRLDVRDGKGHGFRPKLSRKEA